jgi:AraC family carnitine catabolism transcriptional activator
MQDVVFVLLPKFSMIALYGALEPMRLVNRFEGEAFSWRFLSSDGEPVAASNEIPVSVSGPLSEVGRPNLVIFCASYEPEKHFKRPLIAQVRRLARQGVWLGGVDTGPFVLAEAGVLDGYRATCHWESLPGFRETYEAVEATNELFEIDRNRLTCAGGAAAIDMMLEYIAANHGRALSISIADQLVHFRFTDGSGAARLPADVRYQLGDPRLLRIVEAMEQNVEEPLTTAELAAVGRMSVRQMERLFAGHLQIRPRKFYQRLRLERAERLLTYSHMSVTDVAVACGFPALEHFTRSYKAQFGLPPSRHRHIAANMGAD